MKQGDGFVPTSIEVEPDGTCQVDHFDYDPLPDGSGFVLTFVDARGQAFPLKLGSRFLPDVLLLAGEASRDLARLGGDDQAITVRRATPPGKAIPVTIKRSDGSVRLVFGNVGLDLPAS